MKKSPLRKVSKKRAKDNALYKQVSKAYLMKHAACQRCKGADAQVIHHIRGRIGKLLCEVKYFRALCNSCHKAIHDNPEDSMASGWMQDRLGGWI